MPKDTLNDYSATASSNSDVGGINIAENCSPANINNAIREIMSDIARVISGTDALTGWKMAAATVTGTLTVDTVTVTTLNISSFAPSSLAVSGNATIGGTLGVTGAITGSSTIVMTSTATAASFIPSSSTAPANGLYLPAANSIGISSNTTERLRINSSGAWGIAGANYGTSGQVLTSGGSSAAPSWASAAAGYDPDGAATAPYSVELPINSAANTLMIQAGNGTTNGGGDLTVTFPTAFSARPEVVASARTANGAEVAVYTSIEAGSVTTTGCIVHTWDSGGNAEATIAVSWIAFGVKA